MALLDNATNIFGKLSPDVRERIQRFLAEPTAENWDGCYSVCIRPFKTVWQAVIAADPTFPREARDSKKANGGKPVPAAQKWPRVPDAMLVARAIKAQLS